MRCVLFTLPLPPALAATCKATFLGATVATAFVLPPVPRSLTSRISTTCRRNKLLQLHVSSGPSLFESYEPGTTTELAVLDDALGSGDQAKPGDVVTVRYCGRLLSTGKEFDAGTIAFKLGEKRVIRGWDQGLEGLRVGGKRTLRIPPNLAYGAGGAGGGLIPGNADLEFDCELMSVENGPVAEIMANLGIGLFSPRTAILAVFLLLTGALTFNLWQSGLLS